MNFNSHTILLIEDNEDDVFIFRRAYKLAKLPHPIQLASDGQEALDYLLGEGAFADRAKFPLPFLVLLDLKLPLRHGLEVLGVLRATPALADLPVVVLTSSAEPLDVARAQELGAQAYLVKPPSATVIATAVAAVCAQLSAPGSAPRGKIAGDMFSDAMASGARVETRL